MNVFVALLVAMVACAVLGVVIERVAYKPLRNSTRVAALITAIGVSYLLENAMSYFFERNLVRFLQTSELKPSHYSETFQSTESKF